MNKIGVIAALPVEARCLCSEKISTGDTVNAGNQVYLRISGVGRNNASLAAEKFIKEDVGVLISWGVAAALDNLLHAGDLILAERILDNSGHSYSVRSEVLQSLENFSHRMRLSSKTGILTETVSILETEKAKAELHKNTGAIAADMESAVIAAAAEKAGIPFLAIRVISDDASSCIPPAITRNMDASGDLKLPGLLGSLCMRPLDFIALVRLARGFKRARLTLERCAEFLKSS